MRKYHLFNFGTGFHCAEIGYELHRAYWRQGMMTEALPAVLTYGFTKLGLHRIEADPFARNTRSTSLLLKPGFTHEGTLRQRFFFRGHFENQHRPILYADLPFECTPILNL